MSTPESNFPDMILELGRHTQAGTVLLLTTQLDDALERRIKDAMPKLSKTLREKLFSGYGPFSSFSVKIDVAYAMGFITADARHDFHVLRDIRNAFAHPRGEVHFDSNALIEMVVRFRGYKKKKHSDHFSFFLKKIDDCWKAVLPELTLASVLRNYAPDKDDTSPQKS